MVVRHYQQADNQRYYSVRHYSVLLITSLIISALMVVFRPSSSTPARRVELVRSAAGQRSWQSRWSVSAPREHATSSTAVPPPGAAGTNDQSAEARGALSLASTPPATAAPPPRTTSTNVAAAAAASSYQSAEARRAISLAIAEPIPARGDGRRGGLDHEENMRRESDTVRRLLAEDGLPQWRPDPALLPPQAPAGASMGELLQSVPAGGIAWLAFGNSGVTEMLMNWVRSP